MGMDHRWGGRQATNVVVQVVAKTGTTGAGRVINVSLTGAYVETNLPLRLFAIVYLEPANPASVDIDRRIAASVVRHDARGVGLEWCEALTKGTHIDSLLAMLADGEMDDICGEAETAWRTAVPASQFAALRC